MKNIDNNIFIALKKWAKNLASEIYYQDQNEYMIQRNDKNHSITFISGSGQEKIASVIMESMWRND